jgi:hypothetical protein
MTPRQRERALQSILRQAERIRPAEKEDADLFYLVGSICANAEDALGLIAADRERANLDAMLGALKSGSITLSRS